jgi:hypothetical protein
MITFDPSFLIELCGVATCLPPEESDFQNHQRICRCCPVYDVLKRSPPRQRKIMFHDQLQLLASIRNELKHPMDVVKAIRDLQNEIKTLKQQLEEVEIPKSSGTQKSLLQKVEVINGIKLVCW